MCVRERKTERDREEGEETRRGDGREKEKEVCEREIGKREWKCVRVCVCVCVRERERARERERGEENV